MTSTVPIGKSDISFWDRLLDFFLTGRSSTGSDVWEFICASDFGNTTDSLGILWGFIFGKEVASSETDTGRAHVQWTFWLFKTVNGLLLQNKNSYNNWKVQTCPNKKIIKISIMINAISQCMIRYNILVYLVTYQTMSNIDMYVNRIPHRVSWSYKIPYNQFC